MDSSYLQDALVQVLFPRLSKFLADKQMIEFFPSNSLNFLKNVIEQVIERRKAKLEVSFLRNS